MGSPIFTIPAGTIPIIIKKVKQPWGWLGNMAQFSVEFEGERWPSSEALFQALRFASGDPVRDAIRSAASPFEAKQTALANLSSMVVRPRSDIDLEHMRLVLRLKVEQNRTPLADRLKRLVDSGQTPIIENCTSRPDESGLFWGASMVDPVEGSWTGHNWLGRLWMELRACLQAEAAEISAAVRR